jgi:hypothetical protein
MWLRETSLGETTFRGNDILGEMLLGETSLGEMLLGETSLGETSLGETLLGDMLLADTSLGETSLGESSLGEPFFCLLSLSYIRFSVEPFFKGLKIKVSLAICDACYGINFVRIHRHNLITLNTTNTLSR